MSKGTALDHVALAVPFVLPGAKLLHQRKLPDVS